jgi:hypothetical protein
MTFRIVPQPTFWATVDLPGPGGVEEPLEIEFHALRASEFREWASQVTDETPRIEVLRRLVAGWKDADTPFSPEALADLDDGRPGVALRLMTVYPGLLAGARRKNSAGSPVN